MHTEQQVDMLKYDLKLRIRLNYRGLEDEQKEKRKEWSGVRASKPATTCRTKDSRKQALRKIVRLLEEQIDELSPCCKEPSQGCIC
jgi:hypothetical protein